MSTRATYAFDGLVFYCHFDGYPQGAAERFENMVENMTVPNLAADAFFVLKDTKGGPAFNFIRGNDDAEPAYKNRHDGHGDTEWRYNLAIDNKGLMGIQVMKRVDYTDEWRGDFMGELTTWFASLGRDNVVRIEGEYGSVTYATRATAARLVELYAASALRFAEGNPNRKSAAETSALWAAAIREGAVDA